MDVLESKTDPEILRSILAEMAKAHNELRCARVDLEKAQSRMRFVLAAVNTMIERQGD
jgi:hypothetical protein